MKHTLIISLLLSFVLVGCKNVPDEQLVEQFNSEISAVDTPLAAKAQQIKEDTTLSPDQQDEQISALYDELCTKALDICFTYIKKYPSRKVAIEAVKLTVSASDDDSTVEKALNMLKGEAAQSDEIKAIKDKLTSQAATAVGKKFTDFTVIQDPENPETSTVKFSDYIGQGKVVLVDFWASWCGPCKQEIPNIAAIYEKYKGDDFNVLSIAVWDKPEDTKASAIEHGVVWSQIINAQRIPTDIYGISGIPQIMLFSADGTILKRDLRGSEIEKAVAEALGR